MAQQQTPLPNTQSDYTFPWVAGGPDEWKKVYNILMVGAAEGETPLHVAARKNLVPAIRTMLQQYHAPTEVLDTRGRTPFHYASEHGHITILDTLVQFGANVDAQDSHSLTALHLASKANNSRVVERLLDHNAHPAMEDSAGEYPIMYCTTEQTRQLLTQAMTKFGIPAPTFDDEGDVGDYAQ